MLQRRLETNTNKVSYPHINVEDTFNELVREYGNACVVSEKIVGSPDFENADYLFHSEKVVAELKCLKEDHSESPSTQAKLRAILDRYFTEGKIKTKQITDESWSQMPRELHQEILYIASNSIRGRTRKANSQIRATKEKLGLQSYGGLLIIANDGLVSVPPAAFIDCVRRYANKDCESIDAFVFLTANLFAQIEEAPRPALFWFGMQMKDPPKIDGTFINELGSRWRSMVCRKTGIPGSAKDLEDMKGFWRAKYEKSD